MYTIIGLGNPGAQYETTRHNIGCMVIDELARRAGLRLSVHKATNTTHASARIGVASGQDGTRIVMGRSNSFMNVSGGPVSSLLNYYRATPENLIVIHDELDLPFGSLRLKRGGGEGGHNGLKSISQSLGNKNYIRVRFGIGRPPGRQDPADFVLRPFTSTEKKELDILISEAADAIEEIISQGLEKATLNLHTNHK